MRISEILATLLLFFIMWIALIGPLMVTFVLVFAYTKSAIAAALLAIFVQLLAIAAYKIIGG
jgi:hypothetical protein